MPVLHDGIDVAQLQAPDAFQSFLVLVDTVFIGTYPYLALIVNVDMPGGIVTDGRLVELAVQHLAHLVVLGVNDEQALMVRSHPQPSVVVNLDVPHLQVVGHAGDAPLTERLHQRAVPAVLLLQVDVVELLGYDPVVARLVNSQLVVLALVGAMLPHPGVLTLNDALLAV